MIAPLTLTFFSPVLSFDPPENVKKIVKHVYTGWKNVVNFPKVSSDDASLAPFNVALDSLQTTLNNHFVHFQYFFFVK